MPSLRDTASGHTHRLTPGTEFNVGRHADADLPVFDLSCSRKQFVIEVDEHASCVLRPLSATSPTFCSGVPVHDAVQLDRDVEIMAGQSRFQFLISDSGPISYQATVVGPVEAQPDSTSLRPIRVQGESIIGRDPDQASVLLPHVQVSRRHARITPHGDGAIIADLGSSGGTYVNGQRITTPRRVERDDAIGIGPYQLFFDHGYLAGATREDNLQLVARGLTRTVTDRTAGGDKRILDEVSLVIRPQEFVCLLGPAGCGKSTLLSALSARGPADSGTVTLNGVDLYREFELLKQDLVVVPQRDLLHRGLEVKVSLNYTARLRLPRDTTSEEIARVVDETIRRVGLEAQSTTKIEYLSGGQTKRMSLASEILANPSLIFLDEVTSGLDEKSDHDMMGLFRSLAEDGKTLVCITHSLVNVEKYCHLVVILAEGGRLAFVGKPPEALEYFGVSKLGDVYETLRAEQPAHWSDTFRQSDAYAEYVGSRIASAPAPDTRPREADRSHVEVIRTLQRQTPTLLQRYCRLLLTDAGALAATLGQCLLVAVLIVLVFGDVTDTGQADPILDERTQATYGANVLFLVAVSCLWFGCNNASKEIVKERDLFLKEQRVGLSSIGYGVSKFLPLGLLSLVQAALLYTTVAWCCDLPGAGYGGGLYACCLAVVGVALGLAISAYSRTEEFATAMVPAILIPQIILAGGLKPLEGLSSVVAQVAVSSYWGYGLLLGTLPDSLLEHLDSEPTDRLMSLVMLGVHAAVLLTATLAILNPAGVRSLFDRVQRSDRN